MDENLRLWYREPASKWSDALPIGNGRFGAMTFGEVYHERWQLNEDSVWYGCATDRNPRHALKYLPNLRRLVEDGLLKEAEKLVEVAFVATPESQRHYEPLGQVNLDFFYSNENISNYERYLDLNQSLSGVSYDVGNVRYTREVFASNPDNVIMGRVSTSKPQKLSFNMRIFRGLDTNVYMSSVEEIDGCLVMKGQTGGEGVSFCLVATVEIEEGSVGIIGETFVVKNASSALVILAAETTFRYSDPESVCLQTLSEARGLGYNRLRDRHIEDYRSLFSRVSFKLACENIIALEPTNVRMSLARSGAPDPGLISLYYQFGRYLLISSSRPGLKALPATLQGIWNESMSPPWGSKFTININTEMNYWLAETTNLSECHLPLFSHMEKLQNNGRVTARKMYDCSGWTTHHNTDIWADSAPQDRWLPATLWPMGGAWLCTHIWQHFSFTGNLSFLKETYHILRGSVEFFLDFMVDKDGYKVTNPSLSPENAYRLPNGEEGCICIAPTMDIQLLHNLFHDFLAAAEVLEEEDSGMLNRVREYRDKLPVMQIGKHGQLQEWLEDYDEVEPGHRHISHLWGLYPGNQITMKDTDLIAACKKTLARRAAHGGGHTGWSRAWMIALWARLCDGNEASMHVREILRTSTHDSLLDNHPPFQIDGNFGATAGITEMLVQSQNGEIQLLPALPLSWPEGSIKGIRARGGFEVSITWSSGRLIGGSIKSDLGQECVLRSTQAFIVVEGDESLADTSHLSSFQTKIGGQYEIRIV